MYKLNPSKKFERKSKKLLKQNILLQKKIFAFFEIFTINPFYSSLKTHKVNDINNDTNYSSRLTGDLRIIWNFNNGTAEILDLIDIGGHSGADKVYK